MIRLTPGPCMTSEAVRQAAAQPDLNHREAEYLALAAQVRAGLCELGGGMEPRLLGGSGTAAMEAMLTSCVERGPVLVLANGYYSERLDEILAVHAIPHETCRWGWLDPWDLREIRERLRPGRFEAVVATHHETTSGRLNPVAGLAEVAAETGTRVLVDAVSSLGADPLSPLGLHAVCGSANKALQGLPGVSFVLLEPSFSQRIESFPRRTYYLSLPMYAGAPPPLTPPVTAVRALGAALAELAAEGGVPARHARLARQAAMIRTGLVGKGYPLPLADAESSRALTIAPIPTGYSSEGWLARERDRGFLLYGCKGALQERFYQVSTMGVVTDDDVRAWLAGVPTA